MTEPNDTHEQYDEMLDTWAMCRAATVGQRAIHAAGENYLPKLSGQSDDEYKAYLKRTPFYNATGRTVDGMRGLVFKKSPVIEIPDAAIPLIEQITMSGISLKGFARAVLKEVLITGRCGILNDHTRAYDGVLTVGSAQSMDIRPYLAFYTAENILDWKTVVIGNSLKLLYVTLAEKSDSDEVLIRKLTLETGVYTQEVYKSTDKGKWELIEIITPTKNGVAFTAIPFNFVSIEETNGDVVAPPIEDLVYLNISHYQNSADLENGAHISGLPTPYVTGVNPTITGADGKERPIELHIGTNAAWILPDAQSQAGFVQVGADGFASLEKLMDRKEQMMAALGARLIAPEKKQAEAAETASIRRGGENSILADIAGAVEIPIQKALKAMLEWGGISGDVRFELNKEYLNIPMTAQELTATVQAWQSGAISEQTMFDVLQAGGVVQETVTFEEEKARKESDGPALGGLNDNSQSTNP